MHHTLAQSEPQALILISIVKPILFAAVLVGWAWLIEKLDKDAGFFYLPRPWLNLGHLGVAALAFTLMLLIPIFAVGLFMGVLLIAADVVAYGFYRNQHVPASQKWSFSLDTFTKRVERYQQTQAQRQITMTLLDGEEKRVDPPAAESDEAEAHNALEDACEFAFERRGEAIELAVDSNRAGLFVRIDGVRYAQPEMEPQSAIQLIDYIKQSAGLDASDRRKRQTGRLYVESNDYGRHALDLDTSGSTRGLTLTISIDRAKQIRRPLEDLGLLDEQLSQVREMLNSEHQGVVLIAGPKRSGITTTLYSLLQAHDPYTASIVTLEDEVLFECEGVHHQALGESITSEQFNQKLGSTLRGDPNVVMLSRLADEQSAKLIAQSGEDVRGYVPIAERDTFSALQSWAKLLGDRELAANSLKMIVAQRLVRRLCTTCRAPYKPDAAALKKLNLPADKVDQFYRASGQVQVRDKTEPCPDCHGIAYMGRVGVFELMPIDDTARKHIAAGDTDQLRSHLRKQKMLWMQESALHKVVQGLTDIKEVTRTLGGGEQRQSKQQAAKG